MKNMWRMMAAAVVFVVVTPEMLAQAPNVGCVGDLDNNAQVDLDDLMMLLTLYGSECTAVEEPEVSSGNMAISEIMYNPSAEQGNDSDYEFLELHNLDSVPVDLSGWKLQNAVAFTFPEGAVVPGHGFVAVVRNIEVLGALVPESALCFQWNSGESLNNTGETIELFRPDGTVSDEVPYEDNDGWISQPDGGGPSLEWMDIGLDNALPDAWTFSSGVGGTPGAPNSMWGLSDPE
jgi:hypothetical protein